MSPAELLQELRGSQPFLEDFPSKGIPDNEAIYKIGSVVQAALECLEGHKERSKDIAERLRIVYDYTYEYLSPLVIQILMESRRLDIRTTHVDALVNGCSMVVNALLSHFSGTSLSASWLSHYFSIGDFSEEMTLKYREKEYYVLSAEVSTIIEYMEECKPVIGRTNDYDVDRVESAMDYVACLAEVSYILGVIQEEESDEFLQEKITYIRGVLGELLEQSMSFFDSVGHLSAGKKNLHFVNKFLRQADDICRTISDFLDTPRSSLDEDAAFNIDIDSDFLPEYLSN